MYQLTIFNEEGTKEYSEQYDEYPEDFKLKDGQWFDICRLPLEQSDIDAHPFEWDDDDWLTEYLLNEL